MVKRELIAALARRHKDLKVQDVDMMARLVFDTMADALADNQEIVTSGIWARSGCVSMVLDKPEIRVREKP